MVAVCFPNQTTMLYCVLNECVANKTEYFSTDLSEI